MPARGDVRLRGATEADFEAIAAVFGRANAADGVPEILAADELAEELEGFDLGTDVLVATTPDGDVVAAAYPMLFASEVLWERVYLFGAVDPDHRRQGIGTSLMTWGIERAQQLLAASPRELPRFVRTAVWDTCTGGLALMRSLGLVPVRYNEHLLRPLTTLPAVSPPSGIRLVSWPDDRDDEIRAEKNASFADHWGSTPTLPADWDQQVRGFGARPDLSLIAIDDDDRVIGHCLVKRFEADDAATGRREALLDSIGTLREWRGRGVASAMIAAALQSCAADGLTHAILAVDSANPTGAARLYRDLGFAPMRRETVFEVPG